MTRDVLAVFTTLATLTALAAGCQTRIDRVRFHNQPVTTVVNDKKHTETPPEERAISQRLYHYDALVHRPLTRTTELRADREALDINANGEVPDSSWFTNRAGVRELTVAEMRRGPSVIESPEKHKPWTILSSKTGGKAAGFIIEDTRGEKYILKFDAPGAPENESGAHIVVHRLLWALGYNVPQDDLVKVVPDDLVMADDAEVKDAFGNSRPMEKRDIEEVLADSHREPGEPFRALVSKFVPGKPLGGFPDEGVRDDDPNDDIPHEDRRVLRGLYPIFAWLKHTDVKEGNTLDAWVVDENDPDRRYVRHYLIDFGKALGIISRQSSWRSDGFARWIDFGNIAKSALSLGLARRSWDGLDSPRLRGVGLYQVERYDPGAFKVRSPYRPFDEGDEGDFYWGAKLMMSLRPELIRAAVEEAQFTDPRATEYLTRTIIARQRKTAAYWFRRANPVDNFSVRSLDTADQRIEVCFDDLLRRYQLEPRAVSDATGYSIAIYDFDGRRKRHKANLTRDTRTQRICARDVPLATTNDGYTIVSIDTDRPNTSYASVLVHIARQADDGPRVIGVRRLDR